MQITNLFHGIGAKVKLKNYELYSDYRCHRNEMAVIFEFSAEGVRLVDGYLGVYRVRWIDRATSIVSHANIILVSEEWNSEENI